jgi:hypothetical protein
MELAPFEKEAIVGLLNELIESNTLSAWMDNLTAIKRDFNGYGYYLYFCEENQHALGRMVKPEQQKLIKGWYIENNISHDIGFLLWLNSKGEHQLECHPCDDNPIHQSILNLKVTIK